VARLRAEQAAGRLTLEELEERSGSAWQAVELADLDGLTRDLPAAPRSAQVAAPSERGRPWVPGRWPFSVQWRTTVPPDVAMARFVEHVAPSLNRYGYDLVTRTESHAVLVCPRRLRGDDRITVDLGRDGRDTVLVAQGVAPVGVRRAFAQLAD
jgi:hypothetical protein